MRIQAVFVVLLLILSFGCEKEKGTSITSPPVVTADPPIPLYLNLGFSTDKACYIPGEEVILTIDKALLSATAKIRYKFLNEIVKEELITNATWKWIAPPTDFRGYIAEVFDSKDGIETIYATIGIDVSSSWKKFPRYGFLSKFPQLGDGEINAVISNLNRHHINGVQFYDWHNKHHKPLPGFADQASVWKDIFNRDIYFNTVQKYITASHKHNMKAMFYNLIYGAWNDAENEGVKKEWYVYTDVNHNSKDYHPLPSPPFLSNIYLLDPSNRAWQEYLQVENKKVYAALPFDGFHMDQLGDRGSRYKYDGSFLNLSQTFKPFIDAIKADEPQKDIVMNAVSQYGQTGIAQSAADFLYTEVWPPYDTYTDLAAIIKANSVYSNGTKNTVLAAYMNYNLADKKGFFNTPSVLMANAVIFAFGGSHLELGEHMLGKEYFPNDNLEMKEDLKKSLITYYDFLVSYQNLLRDGGSFNSVVLNSTDNKITVTSWPSANGAIAAVGKKVGSSQVIHLINFKDSQSQNWRDNAGVQTVPVEIKNAGLKLSSSAAVKKIWYASPDMIGGASRTLNHIQKGDQVTFTLPALQYWSMIVLEY
ncbi:cycloisomaltooligosaccharide glucanotransferase [Flavihumibacter sp. R14]|nr:cycloisomaltooligosaccharide glucanotransferase [Flavihumibacter soli]